MPTTINSESRSQFKQPEGTSGIKIMETSFDNHHRTFLNEEDGSDSESPPSSAIFNNGSELTPTPIKKPSRKSVQKRVISVPIKEIEEEKMKREIAVGSNSGSSFPPADSWSWRKYGQKPIKGSPYPRAYYRCSSSKGCPARKQVERSRADPTTLIVSYCCDHNHAANASRNKNPSNNSAAAKLRQSIILQDYRKLESEPEPDEKFSDDFGWLSDMEATPSTLLESPIYVKTTTVVDGALFQMREEDESLFADLDELPECSLVFRRGRPVQINDEQLRQFTSPCCGTTS